MIAATLANIRAKDAAINAFTEVTEARALRRAKSLDGPLAGVAFAVKNLFDLEGVTTLAGSKINRDLPPARKDATLVARLEAAGAVCVGALNMDEYAYGFTTENSHYGPTRNPHDPERIAGGSSGGSAAAVAAGVSLPHLPPPTTTSTRAPPPPRPDSG